MNKILQGDCLEEMKKLEDNSVDAIVTDPPYGLSFMGKKWDYDVPSQEIWEECLRVLKPGGYLLSFAGTRTQHRMAVRIEDAGFEIRDMIAWVYGSGFPKSLNIGKVVDKLQGNEREVTGTKEQPLMTNHYGKGLHNERPVKELEDTKGNSPWEGWGTALKPALEPITVARKPLSEKSVAENCLKWGVGGINIDGCRVGTEEMGGGTMPDLRDVGAMSKEAIGIDKLSCGQNPRPALRKEQPTYNGRFPANLIHDGSDEVVGLFPNSKSAGEYKKDKLNTFIPEEAMFPLGYQTNAYAGESGSASRFFYCAKASKRERNKGCEGLEEKEEVYPGINTFDENGNRLRADGSVIPPLKSKNNHPTVKPIALMEYLVKLVSKEGAVVLDPFAGSGSTLLACKKLNRQYIGIEREEDYVKIIKARLGEGGLI